ncbi:MAG TPA: aminotransferase class III-fold pyridoxal phosphate-dependent enzyme [Anaerolineae bacterium]|nr:aminotransferase class III-fold pyridoxal phosphate-dependent enzyme [Anaerolineae bacterium]
MNEFKPQVLSEDEIREWFGGVTDEEFALARKRSLTPLKDEILFQGIPGTALVKDTTGKTYIDCTAQAWTLNSGYCNPDVLAAVTEQMKYLTHVRYGYPTVPRIKLINRLAELFPGDLKRVCLNIQGGGAAVEAAMKLAMINKPGATTFLVAWRGYHGASLATFGASHYMPYLSRFSGFGLGHFAKFPYPYCYRCPIGQELETCGLACLELVEGTIKCGVNTPVAGLIIEPMQGAGGQVPTPPGYLAGLKEICEKYGIYLIYDECQTAFGRIGAMSAAEYYGVPPDMMVLSKSLGGGFPIGALLARSDLKGFTAVEEHTTFGSSPLIFAAALANIEVTLRMDLPGRARRLGEHIVAYLKGLQQKYEIIGDVRGAGLFIGVELVDDRASRRPAIERAVALVEMAQKLGVIFDVDMPDTTEMIPQRRNVIKIKPPLVITDEQVEKVLQVFTAGVDRVSKMTDEQKSGILQKMMAAALGG